MKKSLRRITLLSILAILGLGFITITNHGAGANGANPADEVAIRENVSHMEAGWNRKQAELFARPFAADADYVVINGLYMRGRAAIELAHRQIFATTFKNTTIRLTVKQIRFLRPDVAVVHVNGHRDAPENAKELVTDALVSLVMTRGKNGWEIAAFQNTQVTTNQQR